MEIDRGDVVQLKSGGPLMTVSKIDRSMGQTVVAECKWFGSRVRGELQHGEFDVVMLDKVDPAKIDSFDGGQSA